MRRNQDDCMKQSNSVVARILLTIILSETVMSHPYLESIFVAVLRSAQRTYSTQLCASGTSRIKRIFVWHAFDVVSISLEACIMNVDLNNHICVWNVVFIKNVSNTLRRNIKILYRFAAPHRQEGSAVVCHIHRCLARDPGFQLLHARRSRYRGVSLLTAAPYSVPPPT